MAALARWCVRHRLAAVLLWLLALGGTAAAAALTGSAYSNDYEVPGTESGRATRLLDEDFAGLGGDGDTLVWHTPRGTSVRAADVEQTMTRTLERVAAQDRVASVTSPYGERGAGQISADSRTAYALVTFDGPVGELDRSDAQAVVDAAAAARTEGLQVELGGSAVGLTKEQGGHLAEFVGVGVAAVVLFLAFGSLSASLLPIATALVGVGTAYAGIELLGHLTTVADFAPMLGLLIGLGVGIDYALFLVTRHRRGLQRGLPVAEAAAQAVATTGRAVVFAGATVCIALLGMLILRLSFLDGVAMAACLTVVLTVAASVTLLPALLSFLGMRALSRRERRRLAEEGPRPELPTGLAARWSAFVEKRPKLLGALATAVMAVLSLPTLALHLGTSDQGNDPAGATTRKAYDLLAEGFGPGVNGPLTLVTRVDGADDRLALDNLGGALEATPGVGSVSPVAYNAAGDAGYLTVLPQTAPQSAETSALVDRLRAHVLPRVEADTSLDVQVGGVTASYDDFADVILGKLPLFIGVVIGFGCLLLLLAFRSVGIPLKAAAMNVAAVSAAFGVVVAVFQFGWGAGLLGLGGAGPIEPFLPVIMVSVLFGLSMDYQVFLVSRMYEEWLETGDNRRAVRVGLAETGRVINSAAVIMISVFLAFVLSGDRVIAMFGIGLAAAVALDAFVLRTLLVPALMHLLGGANWWLPRSLDRLLPRISIEPPECRAGAVRPTGSVPAADSAALESYEESGLVERR
ncbi:putative transmembrane transport protein [Streptomyces albus]|uniref:Putative transmembrane transport protein n=1 Tax=Streptomyces albus (strain ATCC 21838 / DSM 41398 / FERM P-419 / JCM 4703 / NBRC 107858) TaxID=1081613 RepID=A0A0B5EKR8_STRA4|nr:putative transmembrane transport protein [Streptomyces albus]AOU76435.1 putative transmembrane transport protein [Streptomyces albus]AYN32221.1 membrane protein [Streptomyces albus]